MENSDNHSSLDSPSYAKTVSIANYVKKWISQGIPIDGIGKNPPVHNAK
jgi:endo-1,4-beta-xylanase